MNIFEVKKEEYKTFVVNPFSKIKYVMLNILYLKIIKKDLVLSAE